MIGVCCADDSYDRGVFNDVAERARDEFAVRSLIAATPPPERDIRIALHVNRGLDHLMSTSLDRCFGLAFAFEALTQGGAIRIEVMNALDGLMERLSAQNKRLSHYGVKVSVYAPLPIESCADIYSFLSTWCRSSEAKHGIPVSCDIARDEAQFGHILETEHMRMVHGDIRAQFAATAGW